MGAIFTPTLRVLQPQYAVPVNRSNPLTRGLLTAINLGASHASREVMPSTQTGTHRIGLAGKGLDYSSQKTQYPVDAALSSGCTTESGCSIFSLIDVDALTNYGGVLALQDAAGTRNVFELRIGSAATDSKIQVVRAGTNYYSSWDTGANRITAGDKSVPIVVTWDTNHLGAYTYAPVIYVKGVAYATTALHDAGAEDVANAISTGLILGSRQDGVTKLDGAIYVVAVWGRGLSEYEAREVSRNPWQLLAPIPRRIFSFAVSAGGTEYVLSPGGTITFSGNPNQIQERIFIPSGTLTFTGTSTQTHIRVTSSSGTITFSGTAPFSQNTTYTFSPGGTLTLSGTALPLRIKTQPASGSVVFSGTLSVIKARAFISSGNITFSGTTDEIRTNVLLPTGTITFSGTAPIYMPGLSADISTRIPLTFAGVT
jgi:hypothetical protein